MNKSEQQIEIQTSKKKTILVILGSLIFVLISVFLFLGAENNRMYPPILVQIVSIIGVLFFGFGILLGVRKIFDKRPGIVINESGIQINLGAFSSRFIFWKNIEGFKIIQIRSARFILILINNPDELLSQTNVISRMLLNYSLKKYGTPASIGSGTLKIDFDELYELLNSSLHTFKLS